MDKAEQVKIIQNVLKPKGKKIPNFQFKFGCHAGHWLEDVAENDMKYLEWLYHSDVKLPKKVEAFILSEIKEKHRRQKEDETL